MLKFIKHNMETIAGVGIFPVISFLIFFVFFMLTLLWVIRMSKQTISEAEQLPLDDISTDNALFHSNK